MRASGQCDQMGPTLLPRHSPIKVCTCRWHSNEYRNRAVRRIRNRPRLSKWIFLRSSRDVRGSVVLAACYRPRRVRRTPFPRNMRSRSLRRLLLSRIALAIRLNSRGESASRRALALGEMGSLVPLLAQRCPDASLSFASSRRWRTRRRVGQIWRLRSSIAFPFDSPRGLRWK